MAGEPKGTGMEGVGATLRHYRKLAGLTQTELERASGVAQDTISQIELGKREPHASTLRKLAEALGVPVAALFEGGQQEVIDLAHEGFAGAQAQVAEASPSERQRLLGQERQATLTAIWGWMRAPTEDSWWVADAYVRRYATVVRTVDGDFLDIVGEINAVWKDAIQGQQT